MTHSYHGSANFQLSKIKLALSAFTFRLSLSHDDTPIRPWNGDIVPSPSNNLERSSDRWKRIKLLDQRIVQKYLFNIYGASTWFCY